jgi:death-on-curing protein
MDLAGEEVVYPSPKEICEINERMCREFGGLWQPPANVRIVGGLEYIIEEMRGQVFGHAAAESLIDKAALLAFFLVTRHIFNEGNKRTAMHAVWEFLEANGLRLALDSSAEDLTLRIAEGIAGSSDVVRWIEARIS